jgi:hypothetical protein
LEPEVRIERRSCGCKTSCGLSIRASGSNPHAAFGRRRTFVRRATPPSNGRAIFVIFEIFVVEALRALGESSLDILRT